MMNIKALEILAYEPTAFINLQLEGATFLVNTSEYETTTEFVEAFIEGDGCYEVYFPE